MTNLVIGNTSQLSNYFPESYTKISSRNIDIKFLTSQKWMNVFLCFGQSKKNVVDAETYDTINYELTKSLIEILLPISKKIIIYSTCELWNKKSGPITIDDSFEFFETPYTMSKFKISELILQNEKYQEKVYIIFPFNFNCFSRKKDFLFGKIFHSIINKEKVEIGNTYFYRDMIHPSFVVQESINCVNNKIVGSGRMIFVNDFIRDLYKHFNMKYDSYVKEVWSNYIEYEKRNEFYLKSEKCLFSYDNLLEKTIIDLEKIRL